ncbi:TetR/AcrR family transcriptional regulator [Treponema pedis]|uniref:TetR/AcrR family transcriptional regulator n=1 Tax=Treponema pedis TaxID=409322 RepID=UPI000494C762|nr:TetR/AcrR family transcriptional regulator [Treponema pedis]
MRLEVKTKAAADKDELNTRAKILHAAKEEFFEKGFSKTGVRAIAEKAGLTTGAIYNLFKNKDGVFNALVGTAFNDFLTFTSHKSDIGYMKYNMLTSELSVITELGLRRFLRIIDFFYDNWDAMRLIVCCAKGSSYEHVFDDAIRAVEEETALWLKKDNIRVSKQMKFFVHVMVSTFFENLKEIFHHNLTKKEAQEYAESINTYHCAGWKQYWLEQEAVK